MSESEQRPESTPAPRNPADEAEWAALAATLAGGKNERPDGSREPPAARGTEPQRGVQRAVFVSSLALLLAVVATMVVGSLWWQYRQFYISLDQTDTEAARSLERVRADLRALEDSVKDLNEDVALTRQLAASLADRVDELPGRFVDLEKRLDAVQGGSFNARSDWLKSEAKYYLVLANTELTLARHWENATTALELADARLAELGDPTLARVRERIAEELLALRSVRLPDIEGLVFSLGRLASRVDELPLRADAPASFADEPEALADAEPGLGRLWTALKSALLGFIRIERREQPVAHALSSAERLLSRRQLTLELELARVAALRAEPEAFTDSLRTATLLLERDFAIESAEVEGALGLLNGLLGLRLTPEPPDISGSLELLRNLDAGTD